MIASTKNRGALAGSRLVFLCPGCGLRVQAQARHLGKKSSCSRCGQQIRIPSALCNLETKVTKKEVTSPDAILHTEAGNLPLPRLPGYEILHKIGQGGMAAVYRARQQNLDRVVAIKTILVDHQPQTVARFEKEARVVAKLQHPNIVAAHDFGRHEGRLFLVMELLDGESLEAAIFRTGPYSEAVAWNLVRQVAAGLAHAGQLGVVHRDIKPANLILVDPPKGLGLPADVPLVKITDFGLALLAETGDATSRLTQSGFALGTPAYMAPEQFNDSEVDCRADIYSLGATAYYALHGLPPFAQDTFWKIMLEKSTGRHPPTAPTLSKESHSLLQEMMAIDPAGRPASYEELIERIDRLGSSLIQPDASDERSNATNAQSSGTLKSPAFRKSRRRLFFRPPAWIIAVITAVFLIGVLAAAARRRSPGGVQGPPLVTSGWVQPLFDGATLRGWTIREGGWMVAVDPEGGQVLSGQGSIAHTLPPIDCWRVTVGVDIAKASEVEIEFGTSKSDAEGLPRYVLQIAPSGMVLGKREGDHGNLIVLSPAKSIPEPRAGQSTYREARIERDASSWAVFFDGTLLGRLPRTPQQDIMEIRLTAQGGAAFFDAPEVAELVEAGA
jgi:serine/threonine protein kinase/predicted RNA-binding Zn-ribbon protein involved in translation (DUF1610 family)